MATKYTTLILNAIRDFDSIFDALVAKSVTLDGAKLAASNKTDGSVPTANYADLITNQLYKITPVQNGTITAPAGEVANYAGTNQALNGTGVVYGAENVVTISGAIPAPGYYDATSTVKAVFTGAGASLAGSNPVGTNNAYNITDAGTAYEVAPKDGNILNKVSVAKGSVTVNVKEADITATLGATSSIAAGTATNVVYTLLAPGAAGTEGKYKINLTAQSAINGTITAADSSVVVAGYVSEKAVTNASATKTITNQAGTDAGYVIELDKATITNITGSGAADLTIPSAVKTSTTAAAGYGYELKASSTIEIDTENARITAGYITPQDGISVNTEGTAIQDKVVYLKTGSLGNKETNAADLSAGMSAGSFAKNADGKWVNTVSLSRTYSKAVVDGYIAESESTFAADITAHKDVVLDAAAVTVSLSPELTGDGDAIFAANPESADHVFTVTLPTTTITKTVTEGYLESAKVNVPASIAQQTFSVGINNGSVRPTATLTAVLHDAEDGKTGGESNVNIFVDTVPAAGDYYTVTAAPDAVIGAGYVTTVGTKTNAVKYLPKAKLTYVESEELGKAVQVTSGGYLPAGLIAEISEITGDIDYAAITVTTQIASSAVGGKYAITLGTATTTDAGYVGALNNGGGTLTVTPNYIDQATSQLTAQIGTLTQSAVVAKENAFEVTVSGNATSTFTLTKEGYIKIADVKNAENATISADGTTAAITTPISKTVTLNKGSVEVTAGPSIVKADTTSVETVESGSYYVDVTSQGNATLKVNEGYVAQNNALSASMPTLNGKVYIKSGTALTNVAKTGTLSKPEASVTGDATNGYKLAVNSFNVAVSGTLVEGYYADENLAVTGSAAVQAFDYDLGKAAARVSGTCSTEVASTGVTLYASNTDSTKQFLAIKANTTHEITANSLTAGYLGDLSQIAVATPSSGEVTKYVELYTENKTTQAENGKYYNQITIGGQEGTDLENVTEMVISTANKYATEDTRITLHVDAMGTGVEASLADLEARLAGRYIAA